jgi:hypothetical protein
LRRYCAAGDAAESAVFADGNIAKDGFGYDVTLRFEIFARKRIEYSTGTTPSVRTVPKISPAPSINAITHFIFPGI